MPGICFYLTQTRWFRLTKDDDLSGHYNYNYCHVVAPSSSDYLFLLFPGCVQTHSKNQSLDSIVSYLCTCGCMDPLTGH